MQNIIIEAESNPQNALGKYIKYLYDSTQDFRQKYLGTLHWTILSAIREYTINIMRKYILEILYIYQKEKIINVMNEKLEIIANLIAFGVGGSILYQNKETYLNQKDNIEKEIKILLNIDEIKI